MADDTEDDLALYFRIEKAAPDGSFVRGWGAVTQNEDGTPATDWEGERLPMGVLREAVHDFMSGDRLLDIQHDYTPKGEVVESAIVDDDFANAMGITSKKRGWWAGVRVYDEEAKADVRKGKLKGFSVGGRGGFEPIKEDTSYGS